MRATAGALTKQDADFVDPNFDRINIRAQWRRVIMPAA
jgi:hypothetical protein